MPQKMIERSARGIGARDVTQDIRLDTADFGHRLGREVLDLVLQRLEAGDIGLDILLVIKLFVDDDVEQRVEHRHVAARLELQRMGRVAHQTLAARVHDDQLSCPVSRPA